MKTQSIQSRMLSCEFLFKFQSDKIENWVCHQKLSLHPYLRLEPELPPEPGLPPEPEPLAKPW